MASLTDISLAAFTTSYGQLYPLAPALENGTYRFYIKTRWTEHDHYQEGGCSLTKQTADTVKRLAEYAHYLSTVHWSKMKNVYPLQTDYNRWKDWMKTVLRFDIDRLSPEVKNPEIVEYSIYHIVDGKAYTVKVTNIN